VNDEDRARVAELAKEIPALSDVDVAVAARTIAAIAEPSAFNSTPVQLSVHLNPSDPSKDSVRLPDGRRVRFVTKIHATSKVKEGRTVKIEFVPDRIKIEQG
jgi:hypothetical protein